MAAIFAICCLILKYPLGCDGWELGWVIEGGRDLDTGAGGGAGGVLVLGRRRLCTGARGGAGGVLVLGGAANLHWRRRRSWRRSCFRRAAGLHTSEGDTRNFRVAILPGVSVRTGTILTCTYRGVYHEKKNSTEGARL